MRVPVYSLILAAALALALTGCGSGVQASHSGSGPAAGTPLRFTVRQSGDAVVGTRVALRASTMSLAVSPSRAASVSCRLGAPMRSAGTVTPAVLARWTSLLDRAHMERLHSDPAGGPGRFYWFTYHGRVLVINFARHIHKAPCVATECMAMMRMDATLHAVLPAASVLSGFIAAHCPVA